MTTMLILCSPQNDCVSVKNIDLQDHNALMKLAVHVVLIEMVRERLYLGTAKSSMVFESS